MTPLWNIGNFQPQKLVPLLDKTLVPHLCLSIRLNALVLSISIDGSWLMEDRWYIYKFSGYSAEHITSLYWVHRSLEEVKWCFVLLWLQLLAFCLVISGKSTHAQCLIDNIHIIIKLTKFYRVDCLHTFILIHLHAVIQLFTIDAIHLL